MNQKMIISIEWVNNELHFVGILDNREKYIGFLDRSEYNTVEIKKVLNYVWEDNYKELIEWIKNKFNIIHCTIVVTYQPLLFKNYIERKKRSEYYEKSKSNKIWNKTSNDNNYNKFNRKRY